LSISRALRTLFAFEISLTRYEAVRDLVSTLVTKHPERALIFVGRCGDGKSTVLRHLFEDVAKFCLPFYFGGVPPECRKEALDFAFNLVADRSAGARSRLLLFDEYDFQDDLKHIDASCRTGDTVVVMSNIGNIFRYMPPRFIAEPFPPVDQVEFGEILGGFVVENDVGTEAFRQIASVLFRETKGNVKHLLDVMTRIGVYQGQQQGEAWRTERYALSSSRVLSYRVG
jgi:hypothetical protein